MRSAAFVTLSISAALLGPACLSEAVTPATGSATQDAGGGDAGEDAREAEAVDTGGRIDADNDAPSAPADSSTMVADARPSTASTGSYIVMGPTIVDANGNPHLFRGMDRPSLEWTSSGDMLSQADYQVMKSWGANVVRISLNQAFWLKADGSGNANPSYSAAYAGTVDQQVQWAEASGLDVIVDLHWSDRGDFSVGQACVTMPGGNCQQCMADSNSLQFWKEVAARYKSDGHVLFELYNEPHDVPWSTWLNGGPVSSSCRTNYSPYTSVSFTAVGMQQLYDAVRSAGANNLVIAGGLQFAYDLSGVAQNPIQGTNILYATHPYNQTGKTTTVQWDTAFGNLSAKYPIIATEFGDTTGQDSSAPNCPTSYDTNLIAYMNKKSADMHNPANEISWTAWAFYAPRTQCTFPALLKDYWDPNAPGLVVQNALMAGP